MHTYVFTRLLITIRLRCYKPLATVLALVTSHNSLIGSLHFASWDSNTAGKGLSPRPPQSMTLELGMDIGPLDKTQHLGSKMNLEVSNWWYPISKDPDRIHGRHLPSPAFALSQHQGLDWNIPIAPLQRCVLTTTKEHKIHLPWHIIRLHSRLQSSHQQLLAKNTLDETACGLGWMKRQNLRIKVYNKIEWSDVDRSVSLCHRSHLQPLWSLWSKSNTKSALHILHLVDKIRW